MELSKSEITKRWANYQKILNDKKLDGILISSPEHIFYLTGYTFIRDVDREAFVLIGPKEVKLLFHRMYSSAIKSISSYIKYEIIDKSIFASVAQLCSKQNIGIEETNLTVAEAEFLTKQNVKLVNISSHLQKIRSIKSQYELILIKNIELITQKALNNTLAWIKAGISEMDIADYFQSQLKRMGVNELAFPTIVAGGSNSGVPHHQTTNRVIGENDIVLIDCGGKKDGYCADITRTIVIGKGNSEFGKVYQVIEKAQKATLDKICHGVKIADIDLTARKIFENEGLLDHFWHTTGHGLGIGIHEYPSLHYQAKGNLQSGMVITVEPGLYFDWGGVRIEDVVVVTDNGYEKISRF